MHPAGLRCLHTPGMRARRACRAGARTGTMHTLFFCRPLELTMTRLRIACVWTLCVAAAVVTFGSRPLPAASPCEWNGIDRIVAVGDVHGAHDRFLEILKIAGVLDADAHWAAGNAHVVQLGDIVDRGPDSRKTLDFVRRLEREAQSAGGQLHLLLGNHEVARMLGDLRLTVAGEYAAFTTPDSLSLRESYL